MSDRIIQTTDNMDVTMALLIVYSLYKKLTSNKQSLNMVTQISESNDTDHGTDTSQYC